MLKNILLGYSQNDFLYANATEFNNMRNDASDNTLAKSLPFEISDTKCNVGFTDREALIQDISSNLHFYIQTLDLGNIQELLKTAGQRTITQQIQNMRFTLVTKNGLTRKDGTPQTSNLTFVNRGFMNTETDAFGRPNREMNLKFVMPSQQMVNTKNGPRYLSITTSNPKCYFNDNCVKKHNHAVSCKTQIFKNPDGTTYCKCQCSKATVFDNKPHSHCEETNSPIGPDGKPISSIANAAAAIDNAQIQFMPNISAPSSGNSDSSRTGEFLVTPDIKGRPIIELIADYYIALCNNKKKAILLESLNVKNNSAGQLFSDANTAYSIQYNNMINIILSVLAVSGAFAFVVQNPVGK